MLKSELARVNVASDLGFTRGLQILFRYLDMFYERHVRSRQDKFEFLTARPSEVKLKIDFFDTAGNKRVEMSVLDNCTVGELKGLIRKEVGWEATEVRILTRGKELADDGMNLKDCDVGNGQIVLVSRRQVFVEEVAGADDEAVLMVVDKTPMEVDKPVEIDKPVLLRPVISGHFEKLFGLLDLPEWYARCIWRLLMQIPVDEGLKTRLFDVVAGDGEVEWGDVFPVRSPFKFAYTLHILRYACSTLSTVWQMNFTRKGGLDFLVETLMGWRLESVASKQCSENMLIVLIDLIGDLNIDDPGGFAEKIMGLVRVCAVGDELCDEEYRIVDVANWLLFSPNRLSGVLGDAIYERLESTEFLIDMLVKTSKTPLRKIMVGKLLNESIRVDKVCGILLGMIGSVDAYPSNCAEFFHVIHALLPRCADLPGILEGLGGTFKVMDGLKNRISNHAVFEVFDERCNS
jgi:hypothetical protein